MRENTDQNNSEYGHFLSGGDTDQNNSEYGHFLSGGDANFFLLFRLEILKQLQN